LRRLKKRRTRFDALASGERNGNIRAVKGGRAGKMAAPPNSQGNWEWKEAPECRG